MPGSPRGWLQAWWPALTIWDDGVSIKKISSKRMSSAWVNLQEVGKGQWKMRQTSGVEPYETSDPDTKARVVERCRRASETLHSRCIPTPSTGMHCWHQMVRVERAGADDRYGDIFRRYESFLCGLSAVEGADSSCAGPGGLRRPLWIPRMRRPEGAAFYVSAKA